MNNDKIQLAKAEKPIEVVKNVGAIGSLKLPPGFVAGVQEDDNRLFKQYLLGNDHDVKLYIEYRGRRINRKYGAKFVELLNKKPHEVDKKEVYHYSPVFPDQSIKEDFEITLAKTEQINGKTVLTIEGNYLKHKIRARTIYIDTDGTGSAIQQVTFQAPYDKASKYFPGGMTALQSIEWK